MCVYYSLDLFSKSSVHHCSLTPAQQYDALAYLIHRALHTPAPAPRRLLVAGPPGSAKLTAVKAVARALCECRIGLYPCYCDYLFCPFLAISPRNGAGAHLVILRPQAAHDEAAIRDAIAEAEEQQPVIVVVPNAHTLFPSDAARAVRRMHSCKPLDIDSYLIPNFYGPALRIPWAHPAHPLGPPCASLGPTLRIPCL